MGNCFGKTSNSETEAFARPGRRLDETPSPTHSTPSKRSTPAYKISSQGQPLGGSSASSDVMEARRAAARAAEVRPRRPLCLDACGIYTLLILVVRIGASRGCEQTKGEARAGAGQSEAADKDDDSRGGE